MGNLLCDAGGGVWCCHSTSCRSQAMISCSGEMEGKMKLNSLETTLENWFKQPLHKLPEGLRRRVQETFGPLHWQSGTEDTRRFFAQIWDYNHDPLTEPERRIWWDFHD